MKMFKKIILSIEGMTCSACSNGLEKYLNKQQGIKIATVNLVMNTASIEYDEKLLTLEDLNRFVKEAGFTSLGKDKLEFEEKNNKKEKYKLITSGFLSIIIMYISMGHMIGLPQIPYLNMMKYPQNYPLCLMLLTSIVILLESHIIQNGIK